MRISDCSSDVCSSDLLHATVQVSLPALIFIPFAARIGPLAWSRWLPPIHAGLGARFASSVRRVELAIWLFLQIGRASGRAGVWQYVSVRVYAVLLETIYQ